MLAGRFCRLLVCCWNVLRDDLHVLGTGTLRALAFGVLHLLTFAEVVEVGFTFDSRAVEEDVSSLPLDETKTLVRQLLNRTLRHFKSLLARYNN
jgi:hypothetical protein